jgi:DNA-directed RNA polymerase specialized sigma24 family protein
MSALTDEEVWALVIKHERALRFLCRRFLPPERREDLDEMYSEVVVMRALSIMATWDESKGASKAGHLFGNVKWYAFKWVDGRAYRKRVKTTGLEHAEGVAYEVDHQTAMEVSSMLEALPQEARDVLYWVAGKGYTFQEVADHLGVSKTKARDTYLAALESVRALHVNGDSERDGTQV